MAPKRNTNKSKKASNAVTASTSNAATASSSNAETASSSNAVNANEVEPVKTFKGVRRKTAKKTAPGDAPGKQKGALKFYTTWKHYDDLLQKATNDDMIQISYQINNVIDNYFDKKN